MSTYPNKPFILLIFSIVMATSAPVRGAGGVPGTDNAFGSRFAYIEKLVERSSVARRVEASANDEAKAKQQTARSFYRQAQDAHKAGNDKLALELLNGAIRNMGEAAQMAARNEIVEEKRRQDFQTRLETVHALFAAHDRISSEVGAKENTDPFHSLIQQKVSQAERLYASGGVISARSHLDEAYGALTVAIEGLRGGRTLVHELYFATKQDEYKYEFDRNRSHRMLVKLLLEDTMHSNPSTAQVVLGLMSKADKARAIAARYAETGRYTAAISAMEKSTGHIVRAIRDAGVYIPG